MGEGRSVQEQELVTREQNLGEQLQALDARVEQVRRELKEAAALQAQLRRDIDYCMGNGRISPPWVHSRFRPRSSWYGSPTGWANISP